MQDTCLSKELSLSHSKTSMQDTCLSKELSLSQLKN